MNGVHLFVWVVFLIALVFLGWFFTKRIKKDAQIRKEQQRIYEEKKKKYKYLKPGVFDECPNEDIVTAVLIHCMRKEDENFDDYFDLMTNGEKVIYGIYQVSSSLQGQNPSLHSFFLSPATKPYVPIIDDIFEQVGSHEIAGLVKAARRFAEIIENDEDDDEDDPEMGDYTRYNFSDFTNEFLSLVNSTNLTEKMTQFILNHKEDFYDNNIPEEELENGDEDNEGISE